MTADTSVIDINDSTLVDHSQDTFKQKLIQFLKFMGPAVLISVGYVDPGNCKFSMHFI